MRPRTRIKKRFVTPSECPFCKEGIEPDYKNHKKLLEFLTARSAVLAKKYSGVCSRHQRILGKEIKRARNLGLLPFLPSA
ncbi:30S ribosomal protein S18 [Candidatus Woesebacteria bacterium GWB1_43_5]|uniref:Small ribosomal subunit protein bS18 n=1 Tax=Candidatus Woesebacteria bacterium GWB1_43_5 TaxID=1802474 RepID=A0A1F7WSE4_9BACT|nr:MAG: 30S ribosomal protein S18 [Candidatus Woesebacteria bacterium GWB1_43_5]